MEPTQAPTSSSLIGRELRVCFGSNTILNDVHFGAKSGDLIGVLGPSGSGKSTLLMALSGFRPAHDGEVTFQGTSVYKDFDTVKHTIGFVPQDDIVPTQLKVERVLKYAAELRLPHFNEDARKGRVEGVLRMLDLHERRTLRVSKLSGGQRKRVSIAVELLCKPQLLFADEPTSGLDPALETAMMERFRSMADEGRIIVVTTHIMSSIHTLNLVCVVHKGNIIYFGPPKELKAYFKAEDFVDIYKIFDTKPPETWHTQFRQSSLYTTYLAPRLRA